MQSARSLESVTGQTSTEYAKLPGTKLPRINHKETISQCPHPAPNRGQIFSVCGQSWGQGKDTKSEPHKKYREQEIPLEILRFQAEFWLDVAKLLFRIWQNGARTRVRRSREVPRGGAFSTKPTAGGLTGSRGEGSRSGMGSQRCGASGNVVFQRSLNIFS